MAQRTVAERFWPKVDKTDTCWLWTAGRYGQGYPAFWLNGRMHPAHRVSYELCVGPIPEGLDVDHLCRTPLCVNPAHLEPVTHAENVRRGPRSRNTHCPKGHELADPNLYYNRQGGRTCKQCALDRARAKSGTVEQREYERLRSIRRRRQEATRGARR